MYFSPSSPHLEAGGLPVANAANGKPLARLVWYYVRQNRGGLL